ncbi:MAG: universal stress protein, partial [Planctomycetota bacterium]|nr:universal stress protein [Planctomycetota bacterium]
MIKLNRILAPTDFSDGSQQGLNCACELAAKFSAELQLLYVSQGWSHDLVESPNSREYLAKANDTARKQLEELPGPSWNERLPLTWFMDNGTPFLQIVKHAKSHDIDLIVMGTHGRTGWSHTLIG